VVSHGSIVRHVIYLRHVSDVNDGIHVRDVNDVIDVHVLSDLSGVSM